MGIALGWTIWAMSPIVTGEVEPWDASSLYYSGSLFIAGMLSTLFWKDGFYWGRSEYSPVKRPFCACSIRH